MRRLGYLQTLRHPRHLGAIALPALLLIGVLTGCDSVPPACADSSFTTSAGPAAGWNDRFHDYADNNARMDDLSGADGAPSTLLPDGRRVWAFGDTFLGAVTPTHGRALNTPMISNTYVEESGGALTRTLIGGTSTAPAAFLRPPTTGSFYWPAGAVVEGTKLRVLVNEWSGTGLDLTHKGTGFVTLNLPGLTVDTTAPRQIAIRGGVAYGAILPEGSTTYFYGVKDRELYVARVPAGQSLGQWEYRTSSSWSTDPGQATPVTSSAGGVEGVKVVKMGRCFVLLTFQPGVFFPTADIRAYVGNSPVGPWSPGTHVLTIPESTRTDVLWYGAWPHDSLVSGSSVVPRLRWAGCRW